MDSTKNANITCANLYSHGILDTCMAINKFEPYLVWRGDHSL